MKYYCVAALCDFGCLMWCIYTIEREWIFHYFIGVTCPARGRLLSILYCDWQSLICSNVTRKGVMWQKVLNGSVKICNKEGVNRNKMESKGVGTRGETMNCILKRGTRIIFLGPAPCPLLPSLLLLVPSLASGYATCDVS